MKKELVSRSAEMIRCPATQSPNVFSFFSGPPVALFTLFYIFPSFLQINFRFCFSSCLAFPTFNFFRCLSLLFSSICLSVHRCSLIRYSSRPTFPSCPHLHTFNLSTSLVSSRYFQSLFSPFAYVSPNIFISSFFVYGYLQFLSRFPSVPLCAFPDTRQFLDSLYPFFPQFLHFFTSVFLASSYLRPNYFHLFSPAFAYLP